MAREMAPANSGSKDDLLALEEFVISNPELERLENVLAQYNLFEAIGAVRVELRHSDFLAFLLDPVQNHGLGDGLFKRLLQNIVSGTNRERIGVSAIDVDVWDLAETQVLREWRGIDILLANEPNKVVMLIENKIDSAEHAGQLARYWDAVRQHYADYQKIAVFLTPEGDEPNHKAYVPLAYETLCGLIESQLDARRSTLGADVVTTISHYTQMLRRHIVSESEIARLARAIYKKHGHALDIIYEHRPDVQSQLAEELKELVTAEPGLRLDHCTKSNTRFLPERWQKIPALRQGHDWTPSKQIVLFEFKNNPNRVGLYLLIGPGEAWVREKVFETSKAHPDLFRSRSKTLAPRWSTIWTRVFLSKKDFSGTEPDELIDKLRRQWQQFIAADLPRLTDAIAEADLSEPQA